MHASLSQSPAQSSCGDDDGVADEEEAAVDDHDD